MLFVEIAAGKMPVIYRSKMQLYLVARKYLLDCYVFSSKAHAMRCLKSWPDRYEFAKKVEFVLLEMPTVPQLHYVQRKAKRKRTTAHLLSTDDIDFSGDFSDE